MIMMASWVGLLSEAADVAQRGLVNDADATTVNGDNTFLSKGRESADGVGGGHIRQEKPIVVCEHSKQNNQCIGNRCPFFKKQ